MRKKVVSVLLTAAMTATMLAGCGNKQTADSQLGESYEETMAAVQSEEAATKETETTAEAKELDYSERVDLVFYLLGDAPAGLDRVEDKINEILLEKANATVDFQFSTWTDWGEKYKLQLTTGGVDLIYTASWNNFGQLAQSGAFLPLDDLLDQVSPDYKAQIDPAALEGCRVNGKIMTIPCLWKQYTPNGIEYREDLREKYDLPVPDSIENLEAYLKGIQEKDPSQGLLAQNPQGILAYEDDPVVGIESGYGQRVKMADPTKVEDYWFSDEFVEDMKLLKDWADKGYWSRSILSNTTDAGEQYDNGQCVALVFGMNPNKYATRVETWKADHPDWKTAYFTFSEAAGKVWSTTPTADATAITKDCKNPERAMKVLELLATDKDLNLLTQYGIEGEDYEVTSDGLYQSLNSDFGYEGLNAWSLRNPEYKLPNGEGGKLLQEMFDNYGKICEEKGMPSVDPYSGFSEDYSAYSAEKAAIDDVVSEYLRPLQNGLVDDVDAAVETFREKVKAAGLDSAREGWAAQWQTYCEETGLK